MNQSRQLFNTALFIILINCILSGFFQFALDRPLFYYEYLLIPVLFSFIYHKIIRIVILAIFILSDLTISLARFYYFDTFNYIRKFPSLFLSHFPIYIWLIGIGSVAFIYFLIHKLVHSQWALNIKNTITDKKLYASFFLISFFIIYTFDFLNGSSAFYFRPQGKVRINIGKSIIREYYWDANIYSKTFLSVSQIEDFDNSTHELKNYETNFLHNKIVSKDSSITYKYLYHDSNAHQLLIIMESWGLLKDSILRNDQIQSLLSLTKFGYHVKFDSSFFYGGTSQAEARELLNKKGEAYYAAIQHNFSDIKGIVQNKNEKGYQTLALQSFSGFHSSGHRFRNILGFNIVKDYTFFHTKNNILENFNNHYTSVNDELVFKYAAQQSLNKNNTFTYILTINTHLPFKSTSSNLSYIPRNEFFPSNESREQYSRLKEQFGALAALLKGLTQTTIVIVGDHPPPFLMSNERAIFAAKHIPALIIKK